VTDSAAIAGDPGAAVQDTALNGAQVSSLLDIIDKVTQKTMSPDTAKLLIGMAFPLLDQKTIDDMVDAAAGFTPAVAEPTP